MAALNTHDNINYGIQIAQNDAPVTFNVGKFKAISSSYPTWPDSDLQDPLNLHIRHVYGIYE